MKRREFIEKTSCGMAGMLASGTALATDQETSPAPPKRKKYKIEVEIYEVGKKTRCFKKGEKFEYPEDRGKVCHWLQDSMNAAIRVLQYGGTLPWLYTGTAYEKVINKNGITTEYIRCPDPSEAGVVAKITRTEIKA